jgi:hypothetical protein
MTIFDFEGGMLRCGGAEEKSGKNVWGKEGGHSCPPAREKRKMEPAARSHSRFIGTRQECRGSLFFLSTQTRGKHCGVFGVMNEGAFTEHGGLALAEQQPALTRGADDDDGDEEKEGHGDDDINLGVE